MPRLVLSPDAVVRFARGAAIAHNAHVAHRPVAMRDALSLETLLQFSRPTEAAELRDSLATANRPGFDMFIDVLRRAGILVPAGSEVARSPHDGMLLVQRQVALLAGLLADLAADCAALDPVVLTEIGAQDGLSVAQRLEAATRGIGSIQEIVGETGKRATRRQLDELQSAGRLDDLKLHIGAGAQRLPGWVNIDAFPAELALNVNRGLPFATHSVRRIFASHVLEHLYYPRDALRFLVECRRVLRPDGRLRLIVPDIELYLRAYAAGDAAFFANRRAAWPHLPEDRTPLEEFLGYAGAGPDPAAFLDSHKYGYDFCTLEKMLIRAGFGAVLRSTFMGSADPVLRVDDASTVADATSDGTHYSLFVEAVTSEQ